MTGSAAGSAAVERYLAATVETMAKAPYCWAVTVAQDGSVSARPMGPQKSPRSDDPLAILFLTRRGSRKTLEHGRTDWLSVVYRHDAEYRNLTLIGRGLYVADREVPLAVWQPGWYQSFPGGVDDESCCIVQLEATHRALGARRDAGTVRVTRLDLGAHSW
jgi:general stress protein 26